MNDSSASSLASDWTRCSAFVRRLSGRDVLLLEQDWKFWARSDQLPREADWTTWLFLGGRGTGKTRAGAEWIRARVQSGLAGHIALVAATAADARAVMVEGESGILKTAPAWFRPTFEPSKRKLTWDNGAVARLFSAEEPDGLRGPQHDTAWCDELAKWSRAEPTWDNLQLGLRLGARPQQMVTTTPRPLILLKAIMQRSDTVLTRGTTYDNRANLAPAFFTEVTRRYEGTRFGRQELDAEIIDDLPGALWTRAMLDTALLPHGSEPPQMFRIVVGVDPSGTGGGDGRDSVGIVVAGKALDGNAYVLADWTCSLSPAGWARRVVEAVAKFRAERVVVEQNFGGAMVEQVLRAADPNVALKMVSASRGKTVRAEPIAALYEQGRVRHAGAFAELEDQLVSFTSDGYVGSRSPDRADAAIWALTELMLPTSGETGWLEYCALLRAKQEKLAGR